MRPVPFHQQPAFRALIFAIVLAATWAHGLVYRGGLMAQLMAIGLDLVFLLLLIQASLFFYAQFVLPVRNLEERLRIWGRILLHARGAHGPAVFVQNGRKIERSGESSRPGPGLVWIDTASAATTRDGSGPKQVLGPGIHFLQSGERVEATFSLHTQTYSVGPGHDEPIFEKLPEDASDEERRRFTLMQTRRQAVSGLTRDGNEVVPEIRVVFKLDGEPALPGGPGSRFGFLRESVERAARSEGVNADLASAQRMHVAWNQLPGLIAVDLWREYLAKFTLDDLFSARFAALPEIVQPEEPVVNSSLQAPPIVVRSQWPAPLLWRLNNSLERWLLAQGVADDNNAENSHAARRQPMARQVRGRDYTALQIIAHMVKVRMTMAAVPILDECGRCLKGHTLSEEYRRLKERGVRILDVTFGGYRFDPAVESQIVQQWRTAWLPNAARERVHVEQLEALAAESGKQRALIEHAGVLSRALQADRPATIPAAVKVLLQATHRALLTDERLHGRGTPELNALSELSKWVESLGNE